MPLTHYMETLPTSGYDFALTMVFVTLFTLRFLQTRRGVYLIGAGLALVTNIYGNPQYLVIPEFYLALLFLLMGGLRYRRELRVEWRSILRSFFAAPAVGIMALTAALAIGLFFIDREILRTVEFSTRMRDPRTLAPTLHSYLYYSYMPPFMRIPDLLTGRAMASFDVWLYFGASGLAVLLSTFALGLRIRYVPELLILVLVTTAFSPPRSVSTRKMGILLSARYEALPSH